MLSCGLLLGQSVVTQSPPTNFTALKGEMKVFEAVIDETMAQIFAPPFGLLEKTKGTYLPGFGLTFSLEVNLYPLPALSPFDSHVPSKGEPEMRRRVEVQRIRAIKQSVCRLLADHAVSLRDLRSEDSVAVIVHLFIMDAGDSKLPDQLVIEARKSDLDLFWGMKITYKDLVDRITILDL